MTGCAATEPAALRWKISFMKSLSSSQQPSCSAPVRSPSRIPRRPSRCHQRAQRTPYPAPRIKLRHLHVQPTGMTFTADTWVRECRRECRWTCAMAARTAALTIRCRCPVEPRRPTRNDASRVIDRPPIIGQRRDSRSDSGGAWMGQVERQVERQVGRPCSPAAW